ncbi:MAG: hypothetical protein JWO13_434 [Acidobacteriales bacterium]|nr:hypothetical protein [Terriglobales bacterium]
MKFCTGCKTFTAGAPSYCQKCGRSYNIKLCPRQHLNPRSAEFCSQCGSREFSTPQPKVSLFLRPLLFLLVAMFRVLPVAVLVLALVAFIGFFIQQIFSDPNNLLGLMVFGVLLGFLLFMTMTLQKSLRSFFKGLFSGRNKR